VTGADDWHDPAVEMFVGTATYARSRIVVFSSWRVFLRPRHLEEGSSSARTKAGRRIVVASRRGFSMTVKLTSSLARFISIYPACQVNCGAAVEGSCGRWVEI
jgi:hypothetical protein